MVLTNDGSNEFVNSLIFKKSVKNNLTNYIYQFDLLYYIPNIYIKLISYQPEE